MSERIEATPETKKMTKLSISSSKTTAEEITQKSERMIKLKTADELQFLVEESIAKEFEIVRAFIDEEQFDDNNFIPLLNVSSKPLCRIIEHYKKHQEFRARTAKRLSKPATDDDPGDVSNDTKAFDQELLKDLTDDEIKEMILAANYLNAKDLLNFLIGKVADHIADKSVEYVRNFFGIENDYAPEEEAELREENSWAFEGVAQD